MTTALSPVYHSICTKLNFLCPKVDLNCLSRAVFSRSLHGDRRYVLCLKKISGKSSSTAKKCFSNTSVRLYGTAARPELTAGLSKQQAEELTLRLTSEERVMLLSALQEFQAKLVKDEYLGQLAASRWRSKFGRPSKLPSLGDVDPTGSYCEVPEDWLKKKYAESVTPPSTKELIGISSANSIPFIGFGFLDNFIMIIAGDYIDLYLGSYLCISTMAAAALGNTFSDVMGIGSAYYVERFANYIGYKPPKLTPVQLDMPVSRQFANLGRVMGVTLGCLLGMLPLLFLPTDEEKNREKAMKKQTENVIAVANIE